MEVLDIAPKRVGSGHQGNNKGNNNKQWIEIMHIKEPWITQVWRTQDPQPLELIAVSD